MHRLYEHCFRLNSNILLNKFEKPGRRENFDYPDMVRESGRA